MFSHILAGLLAVLILAANGPAWAGGLLGDVLMNSIRVPLPPELAASSASDMDSAVEKASNEALVAYYQAYGRALKYHEEERAQARVQIEWQMTTSRIVFVIVVAIVMSGVLFCWAQFVSARRKPTSRSVADIEIGASGVKISSPVLGVIVLGLSLAFFYLYLQFVYPIRIIGEMPQSRAEPSIAQSTESTRHQPAPPK